MIGPKKLSAIQQQLQRTLAATGNDPIRWLEERMATPRRRAAADPGESPVLQSLRRILDAAPSVSRRHRMRAGSKK
ncbi:MAG: hypothetical protein ACHRHE_15595 [Tepidisphaerales bacterium]